MKFFSRVTILAFVSVSSFFAGAIFGLYGSDPDGMKILTDAAQTQADACRAMSEKLRP